MKREKLGIAMACLWLAMLSYGSFPLELSAAGLAIPCVAFALLLLAGFHMERWPVWKAALLSCLGSGIGMLVRYFAEYGEAWWNANFTAENAVRHLLWMTVCGIAICQIFRYLAVNIGVQGVQTR